LALFFRIKNLNGKPGFTTRLFYLSHALRLYTLPVVLANLMGEHVQDTEMMMAGSVITILPIIIVFLAMQKYYMRGIMLGSVKE